MHIKLKWQVDELSLKIQQQCIVLSDVKDKFWIYTVIKNVMPRSRMYGDVIATYIRRAKIHSHIYAKHQYEQESKYGSTVVIYIPTIIAQLHSYHRS